MTGMTTSSITASDNDDQGLLLLTDGTFGIEIHNVTAAEHQQAKGAKTSGGERIIFPVHRIPRKALKAPGERRRSRPRPYAGPGKRVEDGPTSQHQPNIVDTSVVRINPRTICPSPPEGSCAEPVAAAAVGIVNAAFSSTHYLRLAAHVLTPPHRRAYTTPHRLSGKRYEPLYRTPNDDTDSQHC